MADSRWTWSQKLFGFLILVVMVVVAISMVIGLAIDNKDRVQLLLNGASRNDIIIYCVSWIVLLIISVSATVQVKEILASRSSDTLRRRADQIAIIIGLVLIIFLFKQPYLDLLFRGKQSSIWIKTMLLGGSGASGWLVWYLRQIERYGEFFHVFLMTIIVGLCWYARLTAPEDVQLSTVTFLVASLFRIAKDYMDAAARGESLAGTEQNAAKKAAITS